MTKTLKNKGKIIELSILVLALVLVLAVKAFDYYTEPDVQEVVKSDVRIEIEDKAKVEMIQVHIKGEVNTQGVYELPKESRMNDLVELAGGFTEAAERDSINLAAKLFDTQQVVVYKIGEAPVVPVINPVGQWTIADLNQSQKIRLMEINGIGETMADRIIAYRESEGPFSNLDELLNVSGIGEKKLESIKTAFAQNE